MVLRWGNNQLLKLRRRKKAESYNVTCQAKRMILGERLLQGIPGRIPGNVVHCMVPYGTEMAVARQPVGLFPNFFSVSDFLWHGLAGSIKNLILKI